MKLKPNLTTLLALSLLCGLVAQQNVQAKQGATDPIPGTSKGGVSTGGGKSTTPTPTPTPTPPPVLASGTITFAASGPVNGSMPVCTGDYRVNAYYPTLYDMTVNVNVSSLDVPDGSLLYINVVGAGGTLYPYTSNAIVVTGGVGSCSEKVFVTLGASLAGVVVSDASGLVIFAGN